MHAEYQAPTCSVITDVSSSQSQGMVPFSAGWCLKRETRLTALCKERPDSLHCLRRHQTHRTVEGET